MLQRKSCRIGQEFDRSIPPVDSVFRHNFRLEAEELRIGGIDCNADPVRVGPAERLDAREVLEQPVRLSAVERLVDAK